MSESSYKQTFNIVVEELSEMMSRREELENELEKVNRRIENLHHSLNGLGELFDPYAVVKLAKQRPELFPYLSIREDMGFTDAIRDVLQSGFGSWLTAIEVRDMLAAGGFDVDKYKNVLASIHAILKRLAVKGEVETRSESGKAEYIWKKATHRRSGATY